MLLCKILIIFSRFLIIFSCKILIIFTEEWLCISYCLPQFSDSFLESSSLLPNVPGVFNDAELISCPDTQEPEILNTLRQYVTEYCVIGSLNINSLSEKFNEVQEWIQAFDILTIQETKIDRSLSDSQFAIRGYNMYRRDRKKESGGILVYIRQSVPTYRLRVKSNEVESILLDIEVGQQHISLLCAYKIPSVNNDVFSDEIYTLLDTTISNWSNVICFGDLNSDILHPLDNGKEGGAWLDICDIYDLQNLITEPTRIFCTKESCFDIIAKNIPTFVL